MNMNRREFLQLLGMASAGGFLLHNSDSRAADSMDGMYELPRYGNVSLLHITDCHAQLNPIYYREPHVNLGVGAMNGQPPHLVGEALLKHFGIHPGTPEA